MEADKKTQSMWCDRHMMWKKKTKCLDGSFLCFCPKCGPVVDLLEMMGLEDSEIDEIIAVNRETLEKRKA